MDTNELKKVLNQGRYVMVGFDQLKYTFQNDTLKISGVEQANMVKYEVYTENNRNFISTNPSLYNEDMEIIMNNSGEGFSLTGKLTGKSYGLMRRDMI